MCYLEGAAIKPVGMNFSHISCLSPCGGLCHLGTLLARSLTLDVVFSLGPRISFYLTHSWVWCYSNRKQNTMLLITEVLIHMLVLHKSCLSRTQTHRSWEACLLCSLILQIFTNRKWHSSLIFPLIILC